MCLSSSIRRQSLKSCLANDTKTLLPVKKEPEESLNELPIRVSSSAIPDESKSCDTLNPKSQEKSKKKRKIIHNYHDHMNDSEANNKTEEYCTRGGVTVPFPLKLYDMLNSLEMKNMTHIVSWQPHGRCFAVHKPREFVEVVLTKFFQQKKYASFQRQLNLYGFSRITKGYDKGGYYHELFLRGKRFLANQIQRIKIKGTGARMASDSDSEPNFYAMTPATGLTKNVDLSKKKSSCKALQFHQAREPYLCKPLLRNNRMRTYLRSIKSTSLISSLDDSILLKTIPGSEEDDKGLLLLYSSLTNEFSKNITNNHTDHNSSAFLSKREKIANNKFEEMDDYSPYINSENGELTVIGNEYMNDQEFFFLVQEIFL